MAAANAKFNAKSPTIRRILREAQELATSPSADYHAAPLETDLFEWHFTLRGPPRSPFERGIYHGRIVLPPTYPLRPPSFRFLTPSGRFETNREICLSISGHHEETWQPAWGIRTALVALRTFMETDVRGQLGGLEAGEEVRRRLAAESRGWRCAVCGGGGGGGGGGEGGEGEGARTNEEILRECEERAREAAAAKKEGEAASAAAEEEEEEKVPEELRMGWRDEMGGGEGKGKEKEEEEEEEEEWGGEESARLAEGFVQTTPPGAASGSSSTRSGTTTTSTAAVPPATAGPVPRPQAPLGPALQQAVRQRTGNEDVLLDGLILALAIALVAVIAKVMLF